MVYIRIKNIANHKYAYVARSIATKKGSRQKIVKYLGRVYELEMKSDVVRQKIHAKTATKFLLELVIPTLKSLGFSKKESHFTFKNMVFSPKTLTLSKKKTKKNVVVKLQEGYLCTFTLSRICNFKKSKDVTKDATLLATYFHQAGIEITPEDFVRYYQLL